MSSPFDRLGSEAGSSSDVSRRALLGSVLSAGVLGSLSGYGTRSTLSDAETVDNTFGSGQLDLGIAWTESYNGQQIESAGACGSTDPADYVDNSGAVITLDGIEPGDTGAVTTCLLLNENATVWFRLAPGAFQENGRSTLEEEAGDSTADEGELQNELEVEVWLEEDCDGTRESGEETLASGTLASVVDGSLGEGIALPDGATAPGCLSVRWELPGDASPTVLSDSVEFGIEFYAQQSRHNDTPQNPWGDA